MTKPKADKFFILVLFILATTLAVLNYEPGTWLTGWDNHHPEFNSSLNIVRDLKTVWRANRGLGLVDGISHASDLPRELFIGVLSLFLQDSVIRYFVTFLMLPLGSLGVFIFIRKHVFPEESILYAFMGGAFYLLSPATVQNFYTPLSTFTVLYGFLPWLLSAVVSYLELGARKELKKFALLSLLATPFGYTATLYAVYLGLVMVIGIVHSLFHGHNLKRILALVGVSIAINSFWLLPFSYFALTKSDVVSEAQTNQLSSEEVVFRNKAYGNIADFPLLKGYQLSARETNFSTGTHGLIYLPWIDHMDSTAFMIVGYTFFGLILYGLFISLRGRVVAGRMIGAVFVVSGLFLLSGTQVLGSILDFLRDGVPVAGEALRFAYTKFSIFALFSFAVLFVVGFSSLGDILKRNFSQAGVLLTWGFGLLAVLLMGYLVKPAFSGNLIYSRLRADIPQEYFEFFDYMGDLDKEGRVLYLPVYEHWPWRRHSWGYVGSGFFRYGLKNPLVDRAFDVWSPYNETLFKELRNAQIIGDTDMFFNTLEKYDVKYIVHDSSIVNTSISDEFRNRTDILYKGLGRSGDIKMLSEFGSNLTLYEYQPIPKVRKNNLLGSLYGDNYEDVFSISGNELILSKEAPIDGFLAVSSADYLEEATQVSVSVEAQEGKQTVVVSPVTTGVKGSSGVLAPEFNPIVSVLNLNEAYLVTIGSKILGPVSPDFSGELGIVGLTSEDPRTMIVSSAAPVNQTAVFESYFDAELFSCGELSSGSFEINRGEEGIVIEASNNLACVNTGALNTGLVGISSIDIALNDSENSTVRYCLLGNNGCLNKKRDLVSNEEGNYKDFFFTSSLKEANSFEIYVSPVENETNALIEISDVLLSQYNNLLQVPLEFDIGESLKSIPIKKEELLTTSLVTKDLDVLFSDSRCSVNLPEKYSENFVGYSTEGNNHVLTSLNSTGCYKTVLPDVSLDSLIVTTKVENVSGMHPQICVRDLSTDECIARHKLDIGFNHTVVPSGDWQNGLGLEIYNPSFANVVTENRITDISYSEFPLSYLNNISVFIPGKAVLTTNGQSFDRGWIALCGAKICPAEHVLANDWSNGWVFEDPSVAPNAVFVYWPQILQFIGYLALLGTLFFLIIPIKKDSKTTTL